MLAAAAATLALMGGAEDPGYTFARSLALAGPRPAGGKAERRAHRRVAAAFGDAGLAVTYDRFAVPGKPRSRNVIGVLAGPRDCLWVVMAHTDTVPPAPGAEDNASGVGALVALAPGLAALQPRCDVWLVATGAEERIYTGTARPPRRERPGAPHPQQRTRSRPALGALARRGRARPRDVAALAGPARPASGGCSPPRPAAGCACAGSPTTGTRQLRPPRVQPRGPCARRSSACPTTRSATRRRDRAGRLREATFVRVRRLLEALLQG